MSNIGSLIFLKLFPLLKLIPLYYYDKVFRLIDKDATSIVDIGCGQGLPMKVIKHRLGCRVYYVGIDIFKPYILLAKKNKTHDDFILADVNFLPLREREVDTIICLELIEHLPKTDGVNLLKNFEKIAKRQIILTTSGFEQGAYDDNPFQVHRSIWSSYEFQRLGYKVYGHGFRSAYLKQGYKRATGFKEIIAFIVSIISSPITWFKPTLSLTLIASKNT